jgi:outer membrane protein OmpA-like peptidoglycan-associated protein
VGLVTQYEQAPVLVITEGEITSRPVTSRVGAWGGFSLGVGRGFAVQAVVPLDFQSGDGSALASPGGGIGDPRIGGRWAALDTKLLDATVRADLHLPAGRQDAWLGERTVRGAVGGSAALNGGFGSILLDLGVTMRPLETPEPRLDWGPTAEFGVGARVDVTEKFSAGASWVSRAVLAGLATGDGELASELLASASYDVAEDVNLAGGGGFGTQPGVGVPTFRVFVNATFDGAFVKKPRVEPVVVKEDRPPPDPVKLVAEDIPGLDVPPPPPEPPAKVVGDEIVFRGEIKFKEDSAEILAESKDVLVAIANLLAADGRIAHLAIEGHASDEGELAYNWDLSDRRARSVWEALILEGIEPQRMSWRGLGEVSPTASKASGDAARAADRRVVLRIARWLGKEEALAATPSSTLLPWNGETASLDPVVLPAPEAPPPKDIIDQSFFDDEEEE